MSALALAANAIRSATFFRSPLRKGMFLAIDFARHAAQQVIHKTMLRAALLNSLRMNVLD